MPIPIMGFIIMGFMPPIPIAPIPMLLLGFMLFILQLTTPERPLPVGLPCAYSKLYSKMLATEERAIQLLQETHFQGLCIQVSVRRKATEAPEQSRYHEAG